MICHFENFQLIFVSTSEINLIKASWAQLISHI
jgi:hypothetical protein